MRLFPSKLRSFICGNNKDASLPSVSSILFHDLTNLREKEREEECCIIPLECPFPFLIAYFYALQSIEGFIGLSI